MQTMTACVHAYSLNAVSAWSSQIWDALKFEVLNATEDSLAEEALTTIKAIATRLSYDKLTLETLEGTPLFRFVTLIVAKCVKHIHEPQDRYAKQSGQIIGRVAAASPFAFHLVVRTVLPELITMHQDTDAISKKKELLDVF